MTPQEKTEAEKTAALARLRGTFERISTMLDDPEYRAHAEQLAAETRVFEAQQAAYRDDGRRMAVGLDSAMWRAVDSPREEPALISVRGFLASPPECCFRVLAGPKGRGKTYALAWAAKTGGGRYVDAAALVATSTFDASAWKDLEHARVLCLDELGAEATNAAYEANLYALLNRRYQAQRKTLIATNLNAASFRARYCEAGLDRLLERIQTGGDFVTFGGETLRRHWQDDTDKETEP